MKYKIPLNKTFTLEVEMPVTMNLAEFQDINSKLNKIAKVFEQDVVQDIVNSEINVDVKPKTRTRYKRHIYSPESVKWLKKQAHCRSNIAREFNERFKANVNSKTLWAKWKSLQK